MEILGLKRGPNGDVGIWSEMVWACVKEEWWTCFEKSIEVWSEGKEEARMTKEDMENASGEEEQECWFEEGGCIEWSKMESGSWRDCCQSGLNLATFVYGDKPGSKLELELIYT